MSEVPAFLLLLAPGAERSRLSDYLSGLPALFARHGGQHLVVAPAATVECFGHIDAAHSVMLSRWPSLRGLLNFWHSSEHQSLARRRHGERPLLAAAFAGEPVNGDGNVGEAIAIFLGPSPTPALLEAEGARALALARERHVEPLEGVWAQGDIAIYAWSSARGARRQLVTFSSGQRGRALLLPTLAVTRNATSSLCALPVAAVA